MRRQTRGDWCWPAAFDSVIVGAMPSPDHGPGPFAVGMSLVAFRAAEEARRFAEEARRRFGRDPFFELSYTTTEEFLRAAPFVQGRTLSAHAPCPRAEVFPNLGSRDHAVVRASLESIRRSAATATSAGGSTLVLHPGYTTDTTVFADPRRRLALLESSSESEDAWLWLREGSVCRAGYCQSPRYREHLETAIGNLGQACSVCAAEGVRLAVENLNPRLTYLFQLPAELSSLTAAIRDLGLCVDLGHLWISSLVHGFDFDQGLAELLATGRVITTHVHDNVSRLDPVPAFADDHAPVGTGSVPIRRALPLLAAAGVRPLMIESLGPAIESYASLSGMVEETCGP
jgi:sugar phosphate isomerase/epimerase